MEKGIILNGSNSIAVAKENDLVHRLNPVPELTPICLGKMQQMEWAVFDLSKHLNAAYRVVDVLLDEHKDDSTPSEDIQKTFYAENLRARVLVIEQERVVHHSFLIATAASTVFNPLYLKPHQKLQILCQQTLSNLTLYCEKIVCNQTINLLPELKNNDRSPTIPQPSPIPSR